MAAKAILFAIFLAQIYLIFTNPIPEPENRFKQAYNRTFRGFEKGMLFIFDFIVYVVPFVPHCFILFHSRKQHPMVGQFYLHPRRGHSVWLDRLLQEQLDRHRYLVHGSIHPKGRHNRMERT